MPKPEVEFVIARFTEDLEWLRDVPDQLLITIYNKGEDISAALPPLETPVRLSHLPNKGREAGTYLHHIVFNYDELAPVTVFLQGRPHDHADRIPTERADLDGADYVDLARRAAADDEQGGPNHPCTLPIKRIYERMFQRPAPTLYVFGPGAQFAVARELIHRKPMSWWALLYSTFRHELDEEVAAHTMERLWPSVFQEQL